jgi:beta-phosphoglucomutase-like phosphatase (HAD superfamily)
MQDKAIHKILISNGSADELSRLGFTVAIFDLDGTVVNNTKFHIDAWLTLLSRHNKTMSATEFTKYLGQPTDTILRHVFTSATPTELRELESEKDKIYTEEYGAAVGPTPGFLEYFEELRKKHFQLALATTSTK